MSQANEKEKTFSVTEVTTDSRIQRSDQLAVEEPLEIRVVSGPAEKRRGRSLSITMRTPGNDFELAVGFLYTEGLVSDLAHIEEIEFCGPVDKETNRQNIVRVYLAEDHEVDMQSLQRNFYMTSSCGICGKASLDAVYAQRPNPINTQLTVASAVIHGLPNKLRASQKVFKHTGGIHAAGLFNDSGELNSIHEDIGRHNAVDKLVGEQVQNDAIATMNNQIIVVSGRASFELVQKSAMAGIPMLVAVGAPSSLAADLAKQFEMTLIGFTSAQRFNVYAGADRVV